MKKHSSIFRSTRGIAFFGTPLVLGTPTHEADLSSLAKLVTQSIGLIKQKDIIDVYRRGFESVLANNPTDFNKIHKARTDGGLLPIEIACFYEELSTEGYGFVGQAEQVLIHLLTPRNRSCLEVRPCCRTAPPLESTEIIWI